MRVAGLACEDIAAQDLEEHDEPVEMQAAHDAQEEPVHVDVRLELHQIPSEVATSEDVVDDLGKTEDSSDEPYDHHTDECCCCTVSINCAAQNFAQSAEDVRQIVQVGNDWAKYYEVAEDVWEVETKSCDVVQKHLLKVIWSWVYCNMLHKTVKVVAKRPQAVLQDLSWVLLKDRVKSRFGIVSASEATQIPWQNVCVL